MARLIRWFVLATLIATPLSLRMDAAGAGAATPSPALPVLTLRATDAGLFAPAETVAGWQTVRLENDTNGLLATDLMLLPPGKTIDDYFSEVYDFRALSYPDWFSEIIFAGSPVALQRGVVEVVVELTPGEWWIVASSGGDATPTPLDVVTGAVSADEPGFADAVEVTLSDSGLSAPTEIAAGPRWWRFTVVGGGVHAPCISRLPGDFTVDQLKGYFTAGTPIPGFRLNQLVATAQVGFIQSGRRAWVEFDLAPGRYLILDCGVDLDRARWLWQGMLAVTAIASR